MQTYQSTPDFYRDYIEHGWLKDQASKVHKYISRWRGKNGKWYYSYKSKAQELGAKIDRKIKGIDNDQISRTDYWDYSNPNKPRVIGKTSRYVLGKDSGKANSRSGQTGSRVNSGRKRAIKKAIKKGNLTSRGYSDSKSSSNNKATEKKIARREHMDYLKSNSVRNTRYGWEENPNGSIIDKETGKRYTPYRKRRKINK